MGLAGPYVHVVVVKVVVAKVVGAIIAAIFVRHFPAGVLPFAGLLNCMPAAALAHGQAANPILEHLGSRAMLGGKVFDDARSVRFRKQLLLNSWLRETKPSSVPTAGLVERRGTAMAFHVLWLKGEGTALRESTVYRSPGRAGRKALGAENAIRRYLNQLHGCLRRLP